MGFHMAWISILIEIKGKIHTDFFEIMCERSFFWSHLVQLLKALNVTFNILINKMTSVYNLDVKLFELKY